MLKEEAVQRFIGEGVGEAGDWFSQEIIRNLCKEKEEILGGLAGKLRLLCHKYEEKRIEGKEMAYLQVSLVRAKVFNREAGYLLEAFDSGLYKSGGLCKEEYDPQWLLGPFYRYQQMVLEKSRRYVGAITPVEAERIGRMGLCTCQRAMYGVFQEAIYDLIKSKEYHQLTYGGEISFQLGYYRGEMWEVYKRRRATERRG